MVGDFSPFFEIFAVLNLGYATSENFRVNFNDRILQIDKTISGELEKQIELIKSSFHVSLAEEFDPLIAEKCRVLDRIYSFNINRIKSIEIENRNFIDGMKSLFFFTSMFSFVVILLGGFEQYLLNNQCSELMFFVSINSLAVVLIFVRNLFPKWRSRKIKPFYLIIYLLIPFILFLLFKSVYRYEKLVFITDNTKVWVIVSLFITLSAYLLHLFRVFIHRAYFRLIIFYQYVKTKKKLKELKQGIMIINKLFDINNRRNF